MPFLRKNSAPIVVLAIISIIFLTYNSSTTISRGDESIHARVVQELAFGSGTVMEPKFFERPYLNKPPLQFWLSAPLVKIFGDANQNYRIVPIAAGLSTLLTLLFFSRLLFRSIYPGCIAVVIALGGKQVLLDHGMRVATMDSLLLFLTTLSMLFIWRAISSERRIQPVPTGIVVGLAVLTKWIAGLLPWVTLALLTVITPSVRKRIFSSFFGWMLAGIISLIPAAGFIGYHLIRDYDGTVAALRLNIADRLIGEGFHNQQDVFLYLRELFLSSSYGSSIVLSFGLLGSLFFIERKQRLFLLVWALLPLGLYTALHSRLPWYYLTATPALWLIAGGVIFEACKRLARASSVFPAIVMTLCILPIAYELYANGKRIFLLERIDADFAVEKVIASNPNSVDFVALSPKVEGSLEMSRRHLFYLHRLALRTPTAQYHAKLPANPSDVLVLPYAQFEDANLSLYKSFTCPVSDFRKLYDRFCIFTQSRVVGLKDIGAYVTPGEHPSAFNGGIEPVTLNKKNFGRIVSNSALITVAIDARFEQHPMQLSFSIVGARSDEHIEVVVNGKTIGRRAINEATTNPLLIDRGIIIRGDNSIILHPEESSKDLLINWVSVRPEPRAN